jgi:predicted Fe-Mo cluster-binding NifX family protein
MIAALACWQDRIAPVFDTAQEARLVVIESGRIKAESDTSLAADLPVRKVLRLVELSVDTLVCGAISRPMLQQISSYGIKVVPFVTGELGEVTRALLDGSLQRGRFDMPGCCGRRMRRRGQNRRKVKRCRAEIEQDLWEEEG